MLLRRMLIPLAALCLAACGGGAPLADQATAPATAALPSAAPPSRETFAPPPTQAPTVAPSTQSPAPSALPSTAPAATAQATAVPPTQPPAPTVLPPTQPLAPATTAPATAAFGSEVLFLRKGALIAFDTSTRKERQLADAVIDFAAAASGAQIALVRDLGKGDPNKNGIDLWVVQRAGGQLQQLTKDGYNLIEATPSWSPDGLAIAYAAASASDPYPRSWPDWSLWCTASTIHLLDLQANADQSFGPGCDSAFSPDGKRIAYAAPPTKPEPDLNNGPTIVNSIRLINRQGQHGWDFAKAQGVDAAPPHSGRLVYAPAWSPDGKQIVYHRYLGYQALVDLDLTEIAGSFDGKGQPLDSGAGWLLPARFTPDLKSVAVTENNAGDARGFGGYDNWSVTVTSLGGSRQIALPTGALTAVGQRVDRLARGQAAAWSPDGAALAVELPPGWNASLAPDQPVDADGQPGEIWRWRPGSAPSELLVKGVDFASPLAWLPSGQ